MNIKTDLLKSYISDFINNQITDFDIDANKIVDTVAIKVLSSIQRIIKDDAYSDFEKVEKIVFIFENYKIDFGSCHDF